MVSLNLRLSDKTHEKISKIAEQQNRSLNKQIVHVVEQFIKDYEKINGKIEIETAE